MFILYVENVFSISSRKKFQKNYNGFCGKFTFIVFVQVDVTGFVPFLPKNASLLFLSIYIAALTVTTNKAI